MFIDTHTHLFVEEFDKDRAEMMMRAQEVGVEKFILPNIDMDSLVRLDQMLLDYPSECLPLLGLHPCSVNENFKNDLTIIKEKINQKKPIGIGECGLDLYWDKTFLNEQKEALKIQANWAKELQIPIILHVRDAFPEIFEVMDEVNDENLTGIFHCFTGGEQEAEKILSYGGFKLGIGGVVTYKNSSLPQVLSNIAIEHVVLETDSPYLPPVPHRGKRNESAFLIHVAEKLTEIYKLPVKKIAEITTQNAKEIFKI